MRKTHFGCQWCFCFITHGQMHSHIIGCIYVLMIIFWLTYVYSIYKKYQIISDNMMIHICYIIEASPPPSGSRSMWSSISLSWFQIYRIFQTYQCLYSKAHGICILLVLVKEIQKTALEGSWTPLKTRELCCHRKNPRAGYGWSAKCGNSNLQSPTLVIEVRICAVHLSQKQLKHAEPLWVNGWKTPWVLHDFSQQFNRIVLWGQPIANGQATPVEAV